MTALRISPADFGYAPAREARLASRRAFERGMAASCLLLTALFALAFALKDLVPRPPIAVFVPGSHVLEPVAPRRWDVPAGPAPARPSVALSVPLPVPEAAVAEPAPELSAAPGASGATDGNAPGAPAGEATGPGAVEPATPEPGVFQPLEHLPEVAVRVAPVYPDMAREAGVEGTVQLWVLVDLDGSVREVRVRQSVPLLDGAAVAALSRWRFTPALNNGRPVRVWVAIPVRFSLH